MIESELNPEIASVPLDSGEPMEIGVIRHISVEPSDMYSRYVDFLREALLFQKQPL